MTVTINRQKGTNLRVFCSVYYLCSILKIAYVCTFYTTLEAGRLFCTVLGHNIKQSGTCFSAVTHRQDKWN